MPNVVCLLKNGAPSTCPTWTVEVSGPGVVLICPTCFGSFVGLSPDQSPPTGLELTENAILPSPPPPTVILPVGGPPSVPTAEAPTTSSVLTTSSTASQPIGGPAPSTAEVAAPAPDPTPTPAVAPLEVVNTEAGSTPEVTPSSATEPTDPVDEESSDWVAVPSTETPLSTDVVAQAVSTDDYVVASAVSATEIPETAPDSDEDDATTA